MQVLTPSGYKHPSALADGDEVCAFDLTTGAPIINTVENINFVDYAEWCRWWSVEETVPPFTWYRVNGTFLLFREQLIWRNDGVSYTHARELQVGDTIFDDHDASIIVTSIEETSEDRDGVWYRFHVSGDHSYIADGLTVHNASISWTGTGSWTPSNTANWVGGVVPGSSDTAVFPASTGTCTLNFGGTITLQAITLTAFTSTWDNSVNNNNVTLSTGANAWNGSGTGTRTIKLGTATYAFTNAAGGWNMGVTTNLTFTGNASTITFTGASTGNRTFAGGTLSYGTVNFGTCSGSGFVAVSAGATFGTLTFTAPMRMQFASGTYTFNAAAYNGSAANINYFFSASPGTQTTIAASGSTFAWAAFRDVNFTGSPTCADCFDLGDNAGMTVVPPAGLASAPIVIRAGTPY